LETKLKASTKALGEADKKRDDKVAATKLAADQAVKEAEARATKAKKYPRQNFQETIAMRRSHHQVY
jgi:hypothetical protein